MQSGDDNISDNVKIEETVVNFFHALFNGFHDRNLINTGSSFIPDNSNLPDFLQNLQSMDACDAEILEGDIAIDELDFVVKNCANNKSPGLDGLSYEFYKTTWPIIRKTVTMVLQCQLDRQVLISSNQVGATRLLPKVTGIPAVDDLRPITLLNCDYRILTKLFVGRIKPVLPKIIKSGQLCTTGDKNILFGVRNILKGEQKKNVTF